MKVGKGGSVVIQSGNFKTIAGRIVLTTAPKRCRFTIAAEFTDSDSIPGFRDSGSGIGVPGNGFRGTKGSTKEERNTQRTVGGGGGGGKAYHECCLPRIPSTFSDY